MWRSHVYILIATKPSTFWSICQKGTDLDGEDELGGDEDGEGDDS